MANGKLTPKQEAFVREYLVDLNAAAAYRRAGYKAKDDHNASVNASALMAKHGIASAIKAAIDARKERALVSADDVVKELKLLAFSDVGHIVDLDTGEMRQGVRRRARRAISSVRIKRVTVGEGDAARTEATVEFKLWSKVDALDKLARHTGVYPEKGAAAGGDEPEFQQEE